MCLVLHEPYCVPYSETWYPQIGLAVAPNLDTVII